MRGPLVILGFLFVLLATGSRSLAQPGAVPECAPTVADGGAVQDRIATRQRLALLTTQLAQAIQSGDCEAVVTLDAQVQDLDPAYHRCAFAGDPAIVDCRQRPRSPRPLSPPRPPDRPESSERGGIFFGAAIGLLAGGMEHEVRLGWVIQPWISVFAGAGFLFAVDGGEGPGVAGLVEGGVRLSLDRLFVEARLGEVSFPVECDFDDPCGDHTEAVRAFSLGVEIVHHRHFGLELHLERLGTRTGSGVVAGVGIGVYH
jgi:hypothetical protein